jgi:hypothetical protein
MRPLQQITYPQFKSVRNSNVSYFLVMTIISNIMRPRMIKHT